MKTNIAAQIGQTCLWAACYLLLISPAMLIAQDSQDSIVAHEHHPWGRFTPGAWKCVKITTEHFDSEGKVTSVSVSEVTTTLDRVEDEVFTLRIESAVNVAGRRIAAAPQITSQHFNGAPADQKAVLTDLPEQDVAVDGVNYPCQVQQIEVAGSMTKTVTKLYHCADVDPYILKRESRSIDLATDQEASGAVMEVIALEMPHDVLFRIMPTTHIKAVQTHPEGSTVTVAFSTLAVPGGVVAHSSKEMDANGVLLRRGTLELVDYGLVPKRPRPLLRRPFFQRRWQRGAMRRRPPEPPDEIPRPTGPPVRLQSKK